MMIPVTDFLIYNIPAMLFAAIAGVLAYKKINGWGWFLFAALITICNVYVKSNVLQALP